MADIKGKTGDNSESKQVVSAQVAADGTVTIPCCEAELVSVDVADVDLLLGFADGTYVVIPNGALDALSNEAHPVIFLDDEDTAFDQAHFDSDHKTSLGELFKQVGATDLAKAGSLRVVSEHVDAQDTADKEVEAANQTSFSAEELELEEVDDKGPGSDGLLPNTELIDPIGTDPVTPVIPPRPSIYSPGQKVTAVAPTIRIDANITPDDIINIAESDPGYMVTVTGAVGGNVVIGDRVAVTVGSQTVSTVVLDDMTFSADIAGHHFVDINYSNEVFATIYASDGKSATGNEFYDIDTRAPSPTIDLDPLIAGDGVVNIAESQGTVTVTGTVSESFGENLAGAQVTLTFNGKPFVGLVQPDGTHFSVDIPGSELAPALGVEGAGGTVDARIDAVDIAGNAAFADDPIGESFTIDTAPPSVGITLDAIGGDNFIDFAESLGDVTITGTVTGDVADVDSVSLLINGTPYTGTAAGGSFSISVAGSDLVTEAGSDNLGTIGANVTAIDSALNSITVPSNTVTYDVDTNLPNPGVHLDAITGDNVINQSEAVDSTIAVTGWVDGDAQVGDRVSIVINGTLAGEGFVGSDKTFSVNVDGNLLAAVGHGNGGTVDATITTAGTGGSVNQTTSVGYTVDTVAPSPTILLDPITSDNTLNIAEAAVDIDVTGSVSGGQVGDTVTLAVNTKIFTGLVRADGTFSINVPGGDLHADYLADDVGNIRASTTTYDTAGNSTTAFVDTTYQDDPDLPTATITIDNTTLNIGGSANVEIRFSEEVKDFSNDNLTIENGTLTAVSTSDNILWEAVFTPNSPVEDPSNLITLNNAEVKDLADNPGVGTTSSQPYAVDTITPEVVSVEVVEPERQELTDVDAGNSLTLRVTFSEAMNTAVDPTLTFSDDMSGTLLEAGSNWDVSGMIYTRTYTVLDGGFDYDLVTVDVAGAEDVSGNPIIDLDYTAEKEFSVDTENPTVVLFENDNLDGEVNGDDRVVEYKLTFSEQVKSIADVDLLVKGGQITIDPVLSADGKSATFTVTADDGSDIPLEVTAKSSIVDESDNPLVEATSILPVDTLNPRVTISSDNVDGLVSDDDNVVTYRLDFDKPVVDVTKGDLTVVGGVITSDPIFDGSGRFATFEVTAYDNSVDPLKVTVNATVLDPDDRPLLPGSLELPVDTTNATVIIKPEYADVIVTDSGGYEVNYILSFNKQVGSLNASDLTISGGTLLAAPVLNADGITATFTINVPDGSEEDLVVTVKDTVIDATGNALTPSSNTLPVDTLNPFVDVGSTSISTISDTQALLPAHNPGFGQFTVYLEFNEAMDTSAPPLISFSKDVSGSLQELSHLTKWYTGDTIMEVKYRVLDENIELKDISINVSGGQDAHGNLLAAQNNVIQFSIDTDNPVVGFSQNSGGQVSDLNREVEYTVDFGEAVTDISAADLTITGGTLLIDPQMAVGNESATFTVLADDEYQGLMSVSVNSSVKDLNGNAVASNLHTLDVDTVDTAPSVVAKLYTSSDLKVAGGVVVGVPAGSYVPGATITEQNQASSPVGQAARERIDGTSGNDIIDHNASFSSGVAQWSKNLHLDFRVMDVLSTIELVVDPANIPPGFDMEGSGFVKGANTWTLTIDPLLDPTLSDDLIASGLDLNVLYSVADAGGPIDFVVNVNVTGTSGGAPVTISEALDFSWREARDAAEFDVTDVDGNQVMVLPRDGMGVDIYAGDGNDEVYAGAGHDLLVGGAGADLLDGGTGSDTVSYVGSATDVTVSLVTGLGTGGDAEGDQLINVENLIGGDGDDTLIGNASANALEGGAGNDTVSYEDSLIAGVTVSLVANSGTGGDALGDTYSGIENLTGSAQADTLIGDANDNILTGGASGDDLQGGGGIDTASYANASQGVIAALDASLKDFQTNDAAGDTFDQIENLVGSGLADALYGNTGDNTLDGGQGDDHLYASAGDDVLVVNQGHDTAKGDVGDDTFVVSADTVNHLPAELDGGEGMEDSGFGDMVLIEGLGASYDLVDLAAVTKNMETLDISDGTTTGLTLSYADIQGMVGDGPLSELTILADGNDTLVLSGPGSLDAAFTPNATADYTISDGTDQAVIHWVIG